MTDEFSKMFGPDAPAMEMLAHLTALLPGFSEGDFRDGMQTAIEEGAAFLDSRADDGGHQAQILMEQMCGLLTGVYCLQETPLGPLGVVGGMTEPKPIARFNEPERNPVDGA